PRIELRPANQCTRCSNPPTRRARCRSPGAARGLSCPFLLKNREKNLKMNEKTNRAAHFRFQALTRPDPPMALKAARQPECGFAVSRKQGGRISTTVRLPGPRPAPPATTERQGLVWLLETLRSSGRSRVPRPAPPSLIRQRWASRCPRRLRVMQRLP